MSLAAETQNISTDAATTAAYDVTPEGATTSAGRRIAPMRTVAGWLGCTEGRAYTVIIGLVVATVAAVIGVPPTLRDRPAAQAFAPRPTAPRVDRDEPPAPPAPVDTTPPSGPSSPPGASPRSDVAAPPIPRSGSSPSTTLPPAPLPPPLAFGEVALVARIGPPGAPEGIAVDPKGGMYVATGNHQSQGTPGPSQVMKLTPDGDVEDHHTVQGQDLAAGRGLTGLVLDSNANLYALDTAPARVLRVDVEGGQQLDYATIPDLPRCAAPVLTAAPTGPCEPTLAESKPLPKAAAFDVRGNLYVTDANQGTIWKVPPGGGPAQVFHQSADYLAAPGLAGIAVDPDGNLEFVVTSSMAPATLNEGVVYELAVVDGVPGARSTIATVDASDAPMGLAVGSSGRRYVTLRGSNQVLILGRDGAEIDRVPEPGASPIPFDAPVGMAFRGRSVLITNQSATNDPARWAVLEMGVSDTAVTL